MGKGANTTCDEGQTLIPSQIGGVFDGPTHALRAEGFDASEDGTGRGTPLVPTYVQETADPITAHEQSTYTHEGTTFRTRNVTAVAFQPRIGRNGRGYSEDVVPALNGADAGATSDMRPCVAFTTEQTPKWNDDQALTLTQGSPTGGGHPQAVATHMAVRRLTPRECERLQGFPDDYTLVPFRNKPAADGNRYKALGNSMAVPVMRWIGKRIQMVEEL